MAKFEALAIIEALRSGIASREVGRYFSSARPKVIGEIQEALDRISDGGHSSGKIITGKYGEGKTHLLNTAIGMAHDQNMVASIVTLSKETPLSNPGQVYAKIIQNTTLPGHPHPGIAPALEKLSLNVPPTPELLEYSLTHLENNKLYYLFKSLLATQDEEERYLLAADLGGDFIAPAALRKIYRRVFGESATFNTPFVKAKHVMDYFAFLAKVFRSCGYNGWLILFDEAELIGRLGRKSRHKAYLNMNRFLNQDSIDGMYSIFAFSASFVPDVIDAKHEYEGVEQNASLYPAEVSVLTNILDKIASAPQLTPLDRTETKEALEKILLYHGQAYDWTPKIEAEDFMHATDPYGYLLRTRIRAAVEILDQLYQYGEIGDIQVSALGDIIFDEDEQASLEEFLENTASQ